MQLPDAEIQWFHDQVKAFLDDHGLVAARNTLMSSFAVI